MITATESIRLQSNKTPQEMAKEIAWRRREFYHAIEPIVKQMTRLASLQPFQLRLSDGKYERETLWNPEHKAAYDEGQELIRVLAQQILGAPLMKTLD